MDKPFFSIIIPTYNSSLLVGRALSSVVNQVFGNFEIIVMDGLSTDNTLDIVSGYRDERIKILSEKDNGVYDAMNNGFTRSKGQWVYFLGSDDYLWDNEVLQRVHEYALSEDVDFVYGNVFSADYGENYDGEFDIMKLLKQNICHQAIFCRREVFKKTGLFNVNYTTHADYDFTMKCFFNESIRKIHIPLKIAYFAPGGISIRMQKDLFKQNLSQIIIRYGWDKLPESILKRYYKSKKTYLMDLIKRKLFFPPPKA